MTEISFHFNAPDKLHHACRLLRKACNAGHQVSVVGPQAALLQLDTALWTFSALDFIPHCFADAPLAVQDKSCIVLGQSESTDAAASARPILVNLDKELPAGFERFERVIELVGTGEEERLAARARWKHYASRGYAIVRHDVSGAAG